MTGLVRRPSFVHHVRGMVPRRTSPIQMQTSDGPLLYAVSKVSASFGSSAVLVQKCQ
jgi:hypothetical protein